MHTHTQEHTRALTFTLKLQLALCFRHTGAIKVVHWNIQQVNDEVMRIKFVFCFLSKTPLPPPQPGNWCTAVFRTTRGRMDGSEAWTSSLAGRLIFNAQSTNREDSKSDQYKSRQIFKVNCWFPSDVMRHLISTDRGWRSGGFGGGGGVEPKRHQLKRHNSWQ